MTRRDPDETIRAWFEEGPARGPERSLDATLARLATEPRGARREISMPVWMPLAAAFALLLAGVLAFGAGFRVVPPTQLTPVASAPASQGACRLEAPVRGKRAVLIGTGFTPDTDVTLEIDRANGTHITLTGGVASDLHTDRLGGFAQPLRPYADDLGRGVVVAIAGCMARLEVVNTAADMPPVCPDPADASVPVVDGPAYRAAVDADAPVDWWHLDDTAARAADATGSHPGTYLGDIVHAARSALSDGGSAFFDSSLAGAYTALELEPRVVLTGDFTIEAWVLMCHWDDDGDPILGSPDSVQTLKFGGGQLHLHSGVRDVAYAGSAVSTGHWQHWVVTRQDDTMSVYLDGALDGERWTETGWFGDFAFSLLGLDTESQLIAFLDEVAVYDHALTPERIAAHARP